MRVAIGGFDGMHKAHMELINNSDAYLVIEKNSNLTPTLDRIEFSSKILDLLLLENIKHLKASEFIEILKNYNITEVIVGEDFRFGFKREGSIQTLKKAFKIKIFKEIKLNNISVHSRIIRDYINNSDIEIANKLLNRFYQIKAIQIKGQGLGKKELFATINLIPLKNYLIPPNGVYITLLNNYPSITFIGNRSTDLNYSIETHILTDFKKSSLYKLKFIKKLRDSKRFNSLVELKKAIKNDIEKAKLYFDNYLKI